MNTTTNPAAFHPYKILSNGNSGLQLHAPGRTKTTIWILRIFPLFTFLIGIGAYAFTGEVLMVLVFGAVALFEVILLYFIKTPSSLQMDSVGFTLETVSMRGVQENYYLWNDVEYIRSRILRGKNSTSLVYDAVLKSGKKLNFLNFGSYQAKKNAIPAINEVLGEISRKEVREK